VLHVSSSSNLLLNSIRPLSRLATEHGSYADSHLSTACYWYDGPDSHIAAVSPCGQLSATLCLKHIDGPHVVVTLLLVTTCRWLRVMLQSHEAAATALVARVGCFSAAAAAVGAILQFWLSKRCCHYPGSGLHEDALWGWWQQQGLQQRLLDECHSSDARGSGVVGRALPACRPAVSHMVFEARVAPATGTANTQAACAIQGSQQQPRRVALWPSILPVGVSHQQIVATGECWSWQKLTCCCWQQQPLLRQHFRRMCFIFVTQQQRLLGWFCVHALQREVIKMLWCAWCNILCGHAVQLKEVRHWFLTQIGVRSRSDPVDKDTGDADADVDRHYVYCYCYCYCYMVQDLAW